jgi:tripartite-type tricarboxylate transporter receptor subunit TctC
VATVEIGMMHWQGLTDLTPDAYTPLALMNEDPAAVQVRADSPHQTIQDLIGQIRAQPGRLQASGTGQGGIWHLAIVGMLDDLGLGAGAVVWVPSDGSAAGLRDLVAGGVQIVGSSLPEARSLIDAGRVRSLAVMAPGRADLFPDVPTLEEEIGSSWQIGAWRGIVGPNDLPPEVVAALTEALQNIYNSDEYRQFMSAQGYGMRWLAGREFGAFMAESDERLGRVMRAVGITQ